MSIKIGIIADIHEDIKRLEQAFELLDSEGCEQIICLGDLVGVAAPFYGFLRSRNAHAVIEAIKNRCQLTVVGNHDLFAIKKIPEYKAGFDYPENWYALDYFERERLADDKVYLYELFELTALMTEEDRIFLSQLPEYVVKRYGDMRILFSHFAFPDLVGAKKKGPRTPEEAKEHLQFIRENNCTLSLSGHGHAKEGMVIFTEEDKRIIKFNQTVKLTNKPTWIYGPMVAHSTAPNGVLVLDVTNKEIKALPLNTKVLVVNSFK